MNLEAPSFKPNVKNPSDETNTGSDIKCGSNSIPSNQAFKLKQVGSGSSSQEKMKEDEERYNFFSRDQHMLPTRNSTEAVHMVQGSGYPSPIVSHNANNKGTQVNF